MGLFKDYRDDFRFSVWKMEENIDNYWPFAG